MLALPRPLKRRPETLLFGWRRRLVRLRRGAEEKRLKRRALVGESADFRAVDRVGVGGLRFRVCGLRRFCGFLGGEAARFGDHFRRLRVEVTAVPSDRRELDAGPIIDGNDSGADVETTGERRFEERAGVGVGRGTETARRFPNDSGDQRLKAQEERPKTLLVIAVGKVF